MVSGAGLLCLCELGADGGGCLRCIVAGFTKDFYEAYHRFHPRSEPHYEERQQLYELYHHLNVSQTCYLSLGG